MPEWRTSPSGHGEETESKGDFEKIINEVIGNIKSDPEVQLRLAKGLEKEHGIDPAILKAVFPDLSPEQVQQAAQTDQPEPEVVDVPAKQAPQLDSETIVSLLDELMGYMSPDTTLSELQEFAQENPDLVDTAINLKL